jgi:hypothetical protein
VGYKLAYGTDKVDHDAEAGGGGHGASGQDDVSDVKRLRAEHATLQARVNNGEAV